MKNRKIFKSFFLANLAFVMVANSYLLKAEPWSNPDDLLIRHDIHLLVDSGVLNIPITTWPLSWGDIAYNLSKNESEMTLIELNSYHRIRESLVNAQELGIFGSTELKLSKNPKQITSFNEVVTDSKSVTANASYFSKNIAINLQVNKSPGSSTMDESYLSLAKGNYSFSLGSKKNWWGPGWHGSLALSTNARPLSGFSIERNFSDPLESSFLSWIGPWDLSLLIAEIDNSKNFYGGRVGIRPLQNLEIGFTGTSVDNGTKMTCDQSLCQDITLLQENSNYNLLGFDFRSSHKSRDLPFALYGQLMGESLSESMGLFGFETWGSIEYLEELEGYRVFTEVTSTSCSFYKNGSSNYGCAYRESFFEDGYRYEGTNIGHSVDGDSLLLSIGGILIGENSQLFKSSLSIGQLNRGSNPAYELRANKTDYFNFDLGYQFDLYWFDIGLGSFDVGLGIDLYKDKITGKSENEPRIYLAWNKDATINSSETRNYSDYLELIEVTDKKIIENTIIEDPFSIDQYLLLNDLDLNEIILLVDEVSSQRNDGNSKSTQPIDKNKSFSRPNYNLDVDAMTQPNDLSEYMNLMDQTIDQRSKVN
tara:strand:+ start:6387 stop:8162 length:1776 start_codon:yes stop_codon:yes gene_type:complete